jgi:hypothetical protein
MDEYIAKGCVVLFQEDVDIIYKYYVEQYGKSDSLVEKQVLEYGGA